MRDAVALPVTVKHRIGLDADEDYGFVRDFVGAVADAGCEVFIVHARNAVLKGLSPKENRDVPRLRYEVVHRLKREFPALHDRAERRLDHVDRDRARARAGRWRDAGPHRLSRSDGPGACRLAALRRRPRRRPRARRCCGRSCPMSPRSAPAACRCARSRATCSAFTMACRAAGGSGRLLSDAARLQDAGPELLMEALDAVEPALAPA